jgi:hypothetical protein
VIACIDRCRFEQLLLPIVVHRPLDLPDRPWYTFSQSVNLAPADTQHLEDGMPKTFPADTLNQATTVLAACKQIDPILKIGALTQETFADKIAQAQAMQEQINGLELQLTKLRNQRDTQNADIWELIKRVRSTIKGMYGDDSSEYEMVGGTRMSERKRPTRKAMSQDAAV